MSSLKPIRVHYRGVSIYYGGYDRTGYFLDIKSKFRVIIS